MGDYFGIGKFITALGYFVGIILFLLLAAIGYIIYLRINKG